MGDDGFSTEKITLAAFCRQLLEHQHGTEHDVRDFEKLVRSMVLDQEKRTGLQWTSYWNPYIADHKHQ